MKARNVVLAALMLGCLLALAAPPSGFAVNYTTISTTSFTTYTTTAWRTIITHTTYKTSKPVYSVTYTVSVSSTSTSCVWWWPFSCVSSSGTSTSTTSTACRGKHCG